MRPCNCLDPVTMPATGQWLGRQPETGETRLGTPSGAGLRTVEARRLPTYQACDSTPFLGWGITFCCDLLLAANCSYGLRYGQEKK